MFFLAVSIQWFLFSDFCHWNIALDFVFYRRKRGTKTNENKNSIIAIKSAIDPTVESSNSKAEEYKHSDVRDNDIEAQILGMSIALIYIFV